jgi:hypothetical protein
LFSQILKFIPRTDFDRAVRETHAQRHGRGVSCWQQFVSMMFCQLGRAHSLREIANGLRSCEGKLNHLGIEALAKSSLAYANAHRPWQLYERVFGDLVAYCHGQAVGKKKFRFKNPLVSVDSTVIDLCLSMYDWAAFRRAKGAVKLHMVLDHDGYLPRFGVITTGKVADVTVAKTLKFEPGTIVVDDRGYNDYGLFGAWTEQGVYFVTRMKEGTLYKVVERHATTGNVHKDHTIVLTGAGAERKCPHRLRRIEVWIEERQRTMVFLTNHCKLSAHTIAAIYKDRWQIELFFKALKQNLKIKTFVGTSENAVRTQIWTALIAILMLRFLHLKSKWGWSLSNLVALLRMNLFTHHDLWSWINDPFGAAADPPPVQQQLAL